MTDLNDKLNSLADEMEDEAQPYEGDLKDSITGWVEALREFAATPAPQAAPSDGDADLARKAAYWWDTLLQCARLLDVPVEESIPMGVLERVTAIAAAPASLTPAPQGTASGLTDARILEIAAEQDYGDEDPRCITRLARAFEKEIAASLTQAATSEPVARLLHWKGKEGLSDKPVSARTYAEWPKEAAADNEYWTEGALLYAHAAPAAAHPAPSDCRDDGRCQYAIDHGAEGIAACPVGQCCMARSEAATRDKLLPCPFCGNDMSADDADHEPTCFFTVNRDSDADDIANRAAWNRRAALLMCEHKAPDERAEKAQFEAWAVMGGGFDISKRDDGLFDSADTYNAWVGWKNRAALSAQQAGGQEAPSDIQAAIASWEPGQWFDARTVDEMEAFYRSRLAAIREAAREHGYAIGLHGSMRRDFDLLAMPWREGAADRNTLARAIASAACGIRREGAYEWETKPAGRFAASIPVCWTAHDNPDFDNMVSAGHIDLSVIAALSASSAVTNEDAKDAARYRWLCEAAGVTQLPVFVEKVLGHRIYVADGKASIDVSIDTAISRAALASQGVKGGE